MADIHSILDTAWAATQSAITVMLVLFYGWLARWKGLLTDKGEQNMSTVSTTLFLPCLLFAEIGPLATWNNLRQYWAIIVYSLVFQVISYAFGLLGVHLFKMPRWLVPCIVFSNATSLPLLLITELAQKGALDNLVQGDDTLTELLSRGKVYILINALICNLTRFTFGPGMLEPHEANRHACSCSDIPYLIKDASREAIERVTGDGADFGTERTPLLGSRESENPHPFHALLYKVRDGVKSSLNPPMIGGLLAVIAGLDPWLHTWFFSDQGFLVPFTQSIEDLGNLYAVLQMFVLGAHLRSRGYSQPPWVTLTYLFAYRFFIMPVISCAVVYFVRTHWHVLVDPVFDFTMMIGPVGPPALTLAAIVQMANTDDATTSAVASTIVLSYVAAPLVSVGVTMALTVINQIAYK